MASPPSSMGTFNDVVDMITDQDMSEGHGGTSTVSTVSTGTVVSWRPPSLTWPGSAEQREPLFSPTDSLVPVPMGGLAPMALLPLFTPPSRQAPPTIAHASNAQPHVSGPAILRGLSLEARVIFGLFCALPEPLETHRRDSEAVFRPTKAVQTSVGLIQGHLLVENSSLKRATLTTTEGRWTAPLAPAQLTVPGGGGHSDLVIQLPPITEGEKGDPLTHHAFTTQHRRNVVWRPSTDGTPSVLSFRMQNPHSAFDALVEVRCNAHPASLGGMSWTASEWRAESVLIRALNRDDVHWLGSDDGASWPQAMVEMLEHTMLAPYRFHDQPETFRDGVVAGTGHRFIEFEQGGTDHVDELGGSSVHVPRMRGHVLFMQSDGEWRVAVVKTLRWSAPDTADPMEVDVTTLGATIVDAETSEVPGAGAEILAATSHAGLRYPRGNPGLAVHDAVPPELIPNARAAQTPLCDYVKYAEYIGRQSTRSSHRSAPVQHLCGALAVGAALGTGVPYVALRLHLRGGREMDEAAMRSLLTSYGVLTVQATRLIDTDTGMGNVSMHLSTAFASGGFDRAVLLFRSDTDELRSMAMWNDGAWKMFDGRTGDLFTFRQSNPGAWLAERLYGAHPTPRDREITVLGFTLPGNFDTQRHTAAWASFAQR